MTWRHVACVIGAVLVPIVCGLTHTCSSESMDRLISFSTNIVVAVFAHARGANDGAEAAAKKQTP